METYGGNDAADNISQNGASVNNETVFEQRAYHGTRHLIENLKFSLDKIGSGDGGQVHGWGIYLAEDSDVSRGYMRSGMRPKRQSTDSKEAIRRRRESFRITAPDGAVFGFKSAGSIDSARISSAGGTDIVSDSNSPLLFGIASYFKDLGINDFDKASFVQYLKETALKGYDAELAESVMRAASDEERKALFAQEAERLYPENSFVGRSRRRAFIGMAPSVYTAENIEALKTIEASEITADMSVEPEDAASSGHDASEGNLYSFEIPENDELLDSGSAVGRHSLKVRKALKKLCADIGIKYDTKMSGQEFYNYLSDELERIEPDGESGDKKSSLKLAEYGVPGLRYFYDENGGSYNFVIWDVDRITDGVGVEGDVVKMSQNPTQELFNQLVVMNGADNSSKSSIFSTEENIRRGSAAMENVITNRTDEMNAMHRDDVGNIAFIWGEPGRGAKLKHGKGISHLIARRNQQGLDGEGIARKMVDVIANGDVTRRYGENVPNGERIDISYDGYTAVLSLYNDGQRQTWLLTGWEDYKNNTSDVTGEGYGSSGTTLDGPMRTRPAEGAEVKQSITQTAGKSNNAGKAEFRQERVNIRGQTAFRKDSAGKHVETLVAVMKDGDRSTLVHEAAHVWLQMMIGMTGDADITFNDAAVEDWQKLTKWLGIDDIDFTNGLSEENEARYRNAHEKFASAFEKYLREGRAPNTALKRVFADFKRWLCAIYRAAKDIMYTDTEGRQVPFEISDDIRAVMDRILASEEEIELAASMRESFTEKVKDGAKEKLLVKLMGELSERKQKEKAKLRDELRPGMRDEVSERREYRTLAAFTELPVDEGGIRLTGEGVNEDLKFALPGVIDDENGYHIDFAAELLGYQSADELTADLLTAAQNPIDEVVDGMLEDAVETSIIDDASALRAAAEEALHGKEALDELAAFALNAECGMRNAELKNKKPLFTRRASPATALGSGVTSQASYANAEVRQPSTSRSSGVRHQNSLNTTLPQNDGRVNDSKLTREQVRAWRSAAEDAAIEAAAGMNIGKLTPGRYMLAERRHAEAALRAVTIFRFYAIEVFRLYLIIVNKN